MAGDSGTSVTLQIVSDLHLEFHRDRGKAFLASMDPEGVDVLVVAGDLCGGPMLRDVLTNLCSRFPQVVYVLGNHEYYHSSPEEVHGTMGALCATLPNLTWLNNQVAEVAGLRFAGGTLWFPRPQTHAVNQARFDINDFRLIDGGFEQWVYEENKACVALLQAAAKDVDVVVTHHIPTGSGTAPEYRGSLLNHYFVHDLGRLIEEAQPSLWICGHTHHRFWTFIHDTTLVCNPFGYPHEQGNPKTGRYVERCLARFDHWKPERPDLRTVGPQWKSEMPGSSLGGFTER
jgi:Icc-related predicted phosphoesterase